MKPRLIDELWRQWWWIDVKSHKISKQHVDKYENYQIPPSLTLRRSQYLTIRDLRTEPNRHTISNSHNFHPIQTRRFPLRTDLPRDLNEGINKKIEKNHCFISKNTWNTKVNFFLLQCTCEAHLEAILKTDVIWP